MDTDLARRLKFGVRQAGRARAAPATSDLVHRRVAPCVRPLRDPGSYPNRAEGTDPDGRTQGAPLHRIGFIVGTRLVRECADQAGSESRLHLGIKSQGPVTRTG